jgi:hypothetical protein
MKTTAKALQTTKSTKKDLDQKGSGRDNIIRVKIPRSDVEQFTKTTIQKNRRLFRRLANT